MSGSGNGAAAARPESIAVIGMACRFPGAASVAELWRNLRDGVESVRFFSDAELAAAGVSPRLLADPRYVKARAVLEDVESFDAACFGFSPNVAGVLDPQQRLFLECAWEALEDAGHDPRRCPGAIGIFGGGSLSTYLLGNLGSPRFVAAAGLLQAAIGNRNDHLTTMAAYKLDLRGPAVTVQTTCSTSLVAVHLACQSLLDYQCDMALAGGVSVEVPQAAGYLYSEGGVASPDGHCRPFDERAQGVVSGNGAGMVVLKRLSDAVADGDCVRALILGTAANNDGGAKIGYTAPSSEGQALVIATAQAAAGVRPDQVSYVEAHGTATQLGDPIELAALRRVFEAGGARRGGCALGSVKSNFGHLDAAAGVAGLIKTVLALEHRQLPPSLHFERPNPRLELAESPFYVNASLRDWPAAAGEPRRAGVSSFGIGGTNAHVVLEQAPPAPAPAAAARPWQLLTLSARSAAALEQATDRLRRHLEERPHLDLADVAFTLQVGRQAFDHRRAVVCRGVADAVESLRSLDPSRVFGRLQEPRTRPVVFLFPGQGSQYPGMGRGLYAAEPEFRRQVDRCCELLAPHLGLDLRGALFAGGPPAAGAAGGDPAAIEQTWLAQPALFVFEYALAQLWRSWGIVPAALAGHSVGEYVAACLAGVFSLEDALALVAARGRLIQQLPPGAMLAVHLDEAEIHRRLGPELSLAAVNRPALAVVAGAPAAVARLEEELAASGVACRRLHTSHAFHSHMMAPAAAPFAERWRGVALRPPTLPYTSNVTGGWIQPREATDPEYWVRHLLQPVRFSENLATLAREQGADAVYLEVGPGTTLATLARQHPARPPGTTVLSSLFHPRRRHGQQGVKAGREPDQDPERGALVAALGRLWLAGLAVDWTGFHAGAPRRRLPLPTYPFERRRHWHEPRPLGAAAEGWAAGGEEEAGTRRPDPADWFYAPSWRRSTWSARAPAAGGAAARQRFVLFTDDWGLGEALADHLEAAGHQAQRVRAGSAFAGAAAGRWTLDPLRRADYDALWRELTAAGGEPRRIVHLWSAAPLAGREGGAAAADQPAEPRQGGGDGEGYFSLLALAQARGATGSVEPLELAVVSSHMQEVVGGDLLWPEKATLLGACQVIPREYAGVSCRSIDLALPAAAAGPAWDGLLEQLVDELLFAPAEPVVAYRGAHRWVRGFEPLRLEAAAAGDGGLGLRRRGCYLITGGLGGMGLALAEHLARQAQARLVLLARTPLPERESWEAWLAEHPADDPISRRLRRLLEVEALGGEAMVLAVDVTEVEPMRRALAAARRRFGPPHGVIHAAGTSNGTFIQLWSPERAAAVLGPKVTGTRVLAQLLAGVPLDFQVLCSSRSAILGQAGGVDYCAANSFLDAFAHHARRAPGGPRTVAIDWCAWREVGMLAEAAERARRPAAGGLGGGQDQVHPLLGRRESAAGGREVFTTRFSSRRQWVANEHRIAGSPVVPGTTYLEMARAALAALRGDGPAEIHDVFFLTPVRLREDEEREMRLTLDPRGEGFGFEVASRTGAAGAAWETAMTGQIRPLAAPPSRPRHDLAAIRARCTRQLLASVEDELLEDLGPRWQTVQQVHVGDREVLGALELPPALAGDLEHFRLHPALLDRAAGLGEQFLVDLEQGFYLPLSYQSLRLWAPLGRKLFGHVRLGDEDFARRETISFDAVILDEEGLELAAITGYSKKRVNDTRAQLQALAATGSAVRPAAPKAAPGAGGEPETPGALGASETPATPEASEAPATPEAPENPEASVADAFAAALAGGVSPAEGVEALMRVLAHRAPAQVVVSPGDLATAIARAAAAAPAASLERLAGRAAAPARAAQERPSLPTPFAAPATDLERRLAALWQELLGVSPIGVHDNFFDLGGDSVLGIQIVARAHQQGLRIAPSQLFEYQTVAELAAALAAGGAEPRAAAATGGVGAAGQDEVEPVVAMAAPAAGDEGAGEPYPLSPVQEGMLFHSLYAPGSGDYVLQVGFKTSAGLDRAALGRAWSAVLARHAILRSAFLWEGRERPAQRTEREVELGWHEEDCRHLDPAAWQAHFAAWLETDRRGGFDLGRAPLLRLALFGLQDAVQVVWTYHHVLLDGWSVPLLLGELFELYRCERLGQPPRLAPSRPYRDYVAWLEERDEAGDEAFWRRALDGLTAPTRLPEEAIPESAAGYRTLRCRLPRPLAELLGAFARHRRLTLNTLVQGAWAVLLGRLAGEEQVTFGGVVSGRPPALDGVERILGPFINTLPVRTGLPARAPLGPWLQALQAGQLAAREHEHVALRKIQKWSGLGAGQPLFESLVIFENLPQAVELAGGAGGLEAWDLFRSEGRTGYPLNLTAFPGDELVLDLTGQARRFSAATLARLAGHLRELLAAFPAQGWDSPLGDLSLLSAAERQQLLREWQGAPPAAGGEPDLGRRFALQAARTPAATALVWRGEQVTYGELAARAGRLAGFLARHGVGPEVPVALRLDRSPALVAALLGVLQAGGAYVPLPPDTPPRRLAAILESTRPLWLLTEEAHLAGLPPAAREPRLLCVDRDAALLEREAPAAARPLLDPRQLAYVVHTSGSTGAPKGVCGHHLAVANYFSYLVESWQLSASDVVLQLTSVGFDAALRDLLAPLTVGARVVVAAESEARDPQALLGLLRRERVSCLPSVVPSLLAELLAAAEEEAGAAGAAAYALRLVLASGEVLPAGTLPRARRLLGARLELINQYGPTECTLTASFHRLTPMAPMAPMAPMVDSDAGGAATAGVATPIGRPIAGARLLALDSQLAPVPVGVPAELYVGGIGLTRGYLGRPELTAEAFLPDPWSVVPGGRLYRTGDRVRRRPDGALEFLGRLDHQVKIHGIRVEPGEVERALAEHPAVREAAVVALGAGADAMEAAGLAGGAGGAGGGARRRLAAYLVLRRPAVAADPEELRAFLLSRLASAAVPAWFVTLPNLPRTASGKLDRRALPPPGPPATGTSSSSRSAPPESAAERLLAGVWAEVLGVAEVGREDSFFALGGDSLLAIRMAGRLRRHGLALDLRQLFARPRLADLAAAMAAGSPTPEPPAAPAAPIADTGPLPLTPNQHAFFARRLAHPHHWNVTALWEVHGALVPGLLRAALARLVARHDALRLRFQRNGGGWRQLAAAPPAAPPFALLDLSALPEPRLTPVLEAASGRLQSSLDLARGPLLRLVLLRCGSGRGDRLLFVGHHLALDNVSLRILAEDLEAIYGQLCRGEAVAPPPPTATFRELAERLAARAGSAEMRTEAAYWLDLPWERVRPLPRDRRGGDNTARWRASAAAELDAETTRLALRELPRRAAATVEELLLAAVVWALRQWSGETVQLLNLVGHGRGPGEAAAAGLDLTRTVGWLVVEHPLVVRLDGAGEPVAALAQVAAALRQVPGKGVGYGLLRYLAPDAELGARMAALPVAEVHFNYRGAIHSGRREPAATAPAASSLLRPAREAPGPFADPATPRPALLYVSAAVERERLRLEWSYSRGCHRRATVARLASASRDTVATLISALLAERGEVTGRRPAGRRPRRPRRPSAAEPSIVRTKETEP
jgi:amino acid adenylation domain-containing protein/non-ribosomal peptide synthase protein (TIGR01720 family)